jgi:hypothetical protein
MPTPELADQTAPYISQLTNIDLQSHCRDAVVRVLNFAGVWQTTLRLRLPYLLTGTLSALNNKGSQNKEKFLDNTRYRVFPADRCKFHSVRAFNAAR